MPLLVSVANEADGTLLSVIQLIRWQQALLIATIQSIVLPDGWIEICIQWPGHFSLLSWFGSKLFIVPHIQVQNRCPRYYWLDGGGHSAPLPGNKLIYRTVTLLQFTDQSKVSTFFAFLFCHNQEPISIVEMWSCILAVRFTTKLVRRYCGLVSSTPSSWSFTVSLVSVV